MQTKPIGPYALPDGRRLVVVDSGGCAVLACAADAPRPAEDAPEDAVRFLNDLLIPGNVHQRAKSTWSALWRWLECENDVVVLVQGRLFAVSLLRRTWLEIAPDDKDDKEMPVELWWTHPMRVANGTTPALVAATPKGHAIVLPLREHPLPVSWEPAP